MTRMLVYHGSNQQIEAPQIIQGKHTKDFGNAFYCTVIYEQAERWARRFDTPIVNSYSTLFENSLKILEFKEMTEEWLDFIVDCRAGKPHNYDIVVGPIANDQVYNFVANFINKTITREQFWIMAKFKYPTHQIAYCSKEALNALQFETSQEVQP